MLTGVIFLGQPGENGKQLGYFIDGVVYDNPPNDLHHDYAEGFTTDEYIEAYEVGYYEDGKIFQHPPYWGAPPIGYYDNGKIYDAFPDKGVEPVGYYSNGCIFTGSHDGENKQLQIAYYQGPNDGAAAAAFIFILMIGN